MSILVFIESNKNEIKKSSFESLSYAKKLLKLISSDVIALTINCSEFTPLGDFGPDKIISIKDKKLQRKEIAELIGKNIAKKILSKGIDRVAFDRGKYKYHGLIKILAEAARLEGLNF